LVTAAIAPAASTNDFTALNPSNRVASAGEVIARGIPKNGGFTNCCTRADIAMSDPIRSPIRCVEGSSSCNSSASSA